MNRDRLDLDAYSCITILGCTLQSRISADAKTTVQMKVNDFKHIDNWTVDDHNSEHQRDVEWLQREIQKIRSEEHQPQRGVIVITHHAPTVNGTSKPSDLANPWSCAFSTDLLRDKALTDVQWWIFGHTHFSSEFKQSQVRLVSNQRGYVLNGVALQGRAPKPTTGSPFPRIMQMKSSNQREFDVRKVIKI